jgi:YVTN family beta-propeller protein
MSLPDLAPVATISAELSPLAVAVNPVRHVAYVVNGFSDSMTIIDTQTDTAIDTIEAGRKPWDVAVSSDGSLVYVASSANGEILVLDANSLPGG